MAATLRAYGWECGNEMTDDIDVTCSGTGNSFAVNTSNPKTGNYALRPTAYSEVCHVQFDIPGSPTDPSVSVWLNMVSERLFDEDEANDVVRIEFILTGGEIVWVEWNGTNHTWDAHVEGEANPVASGTIEVSAQDWFHTQFYADIGNAGSIDVKVNGHTSITFSGDTLPSGATANVDYVRFYVTTQGNEYGRLDIDDLVIGSGGFLGDLRCPDIRPNADTAVDDWTPSTGDNYSTINDTPSNDGTYNETAVDAQDDELDMTDFDGATYIPVAVTAWVRARQDAGVGDSIYVGVDSGGTDDVSAQQPLENAWEYYFHTLDNNPADAAEWEDADIDALKLRYESDIP